MFSDSQAKKKKKNGPSKVKIYFAMIKFFTNDFFGSEILC